MIADARRMLAQAHQHALLVRRTRGREQKDAIVRLVLLEIRVALQNGRSTSLRGVEK